MPHAAAAAAAAAVAAVEVAPPDDPGSQDVFLPPVYILRRRHVLAALKNKGFDVTLRIHRSTLGIEEKCFEGMERVSRIVVWGPVTNCVGAALLGALIAKLTAYEPALVDIIRRSVADCGDEIHRVGVRAFSGCTSLTSVTLPDSLTHVGDYAFFRCTSLTLVTLPDSLTHVGHCAFLQCTSLTLVTLPDSLTHIGMFAFSCQLRNQKPTIVLFH
jgi:hypothetical protein